MGGTVFNISSSSSTSVSSQDDKTSQKSISLLNSDLWICILVILPIPDLFSMQVVCQYFYNLMDNQFWRSIYRRDFSEDTSAIFLPQKQVSRLYHQYVFPLYNSQNIKITRELRDNRKSSRGCFNLFDNFFSTADIHSSSVVDVASSSHTQEILCEEKVEKVFCALAEETFPVDKLLKVVVKKLPAEQSILLWVKERNLCLLALIHGNFSMIELFLKTNEKISNWPGEFADFCVVLIDIFCDYVENHYEPKDNAEQSLMHFLKIEDYVDFIMRNLKKSFSGEINNEDRVKYKNNYLKIMKAFFYFSKKLSPLFHQDIAEKIYKHYKIMSFDYLEKLCLLGGEYNETYMIMHSKCYKKIWIEDFNLKGDKVLHSVSLYNIIVKGNELLCRQFMEAFKVRFPKKAFFQLLNTLPTILDKEKTEERVRIALYLLEKIPQKCINHFYWINFSKEYGLFGLGLLSHQYDIMLTVIKQMKKQEQVYEIRDGDREAFLDAIIYGHCPSLKALLDSNFTANDYGITQKYYNILFNNAEETDYIIYEKVFFHMTLLLDIFINSLKEMAIGPIIGRVFEHVKVDAETFAQTLLELGNLYCKFQKYGNNKEQKYIILCQDLKSECIVDFVEILKKYFLYVETPQAVITLLRESKNLNNLLILSPDIQDFFHKTIKKRDYGRPNDSPVSSPKGSFRVPRSPVKQFIEKLKGSPSSPKPTPSQEYRVSPFSLGKRI